jgi:O-antigen/teichoic acid export membrane protein
MGVVFALQFPFALYQNALLGLQRQVTVNVILSITGTLRSLGAVAILMFVSPTVEAFFLWQAGVTILQTTATGLCAWRFLRAPATPRFRGSILREQAAYASSVAASSILGVFLAQCDKLLLSALLPLEQFGYYALAGTVAAGLWMLIVPVSSALFPRFAQLVELGDERRLADLYHVSSQFMAVLVLPVGATLAFFARPIIEIWIHNSAAAAGAAPIAALLVAGTSLNALAVLPASLQSAAGWPQLMMYTNAAQAILLFPAIFYMAALYGAPGAASIWVAMNLVYVVVTVPIMHRRLLRGERWRWLSRDVAIPLATVVGAGFLARAIVPLPASTIMTLVYIVASFVGIALAAMAVTPRARAMAVAAIRSIPGRGPSRVGSIS